MKFGKWLKITPAIALALVAVGCDKKGKAPELEFTDPDTGEVVEVKVEATKDKEKVAQVLEALYANIETAKEINQMTTKASVNIDMTLDEAIFKVVGSLETRESIDMNDVVIGEDFSFIADMIDATDLYAKVDLEIMAPSYDYEYDETLQQYVEIFVQNEMTIKAELLSDEDAFYLNAEELVGQGLDIKDQKWKLSRDAISELILAEYEGLTFEDVMGEGYVEEVEMPTLDEILAETGMTLEEVVEMLGLEIAKVDGNEIMFKIVLDNEVLVDTLPTTTGPVDVELVIEFGIDSKTLMPTYLNVDAKDYIETGFSLTEQEVDVKSFSFELEFTDKATFPDVKDKNKYSSFDEMLGDSSATTI